MECFLRFIRVNEEGLKPALCFRGPKEAYAVINDETVIRAVIVTLQECDKALPVMYKGSPYPVSRYVAHMHQIGLRKGITRRAAALLGAGQALPSGEGLPPDELATEPSVERTEDPKPPTERPAVPPTETTAPRSGKKATGVATPPPKASKPATKPAAKLKAKDRGTVVAALAKELGTDPKALRVRLRAAGLRAPYIDIKAMRKALK